MYRRLPKIIPVIAPQIDWNNFISSIDEMTGRSPTRLTDKERQPIGSYNTFIGSMGFFSQGLGPNETNKLYDTYYKMLDFGFLIQILSEKDYLFITTNTELVSINNLYQEKDLTKVALFKGTLLQWRDACIRLTDQRLDLEVRYVFDAIFLYFESLGFKLDARKIPLKDETFMLEDKR